MKKPKLRQIQLATVLPVKPGSCFITMSTGQDWDSLLDAAYRSGWIVLELDDNEKPVHAYQRQEIGMN